MERLVGTELPTYLCSRSEWRARRLAAAIDAFERRHGRPPTLRELSAATGCKVNGYMTESLQLAVSLGLLEVRGPAGRKRPTLAYSIARCPSGTEAAGAA